MAISKTSINLGHNVNFLSDEFSFFDDCSLNEDSVIRVIDRLGINIILNTLDGRNVGFLLRRSDNITDMMKKIRSRIRFDDGIHRLSFNGTILKDDKSIDYYNIGKGSIIDVVPRPRIARISNTSIDLGDKENFLSNDAVEIEDHGFQNDCVVRVIDRLGINIILNTLDGRNVGFVVRNGYRIIDVVKKIRDRIRFVEDKQRLSFNGTILEDDKIIGYYNIGKGSIINVVARPRWRIKIFATTMYGGTVTIEVTKTDRIIDIKKIIQEKTGLLPDEQRLVYQGKILKDDKTIDYYLITDNSAIYVMDRRSWWRQKFVKPMEGKHYLGKPSSLHVTKTDTITDINKIQKKIRPLPKDQKLVYNEEILDDNKTVDDYSIADRGTIRELTLPREGMEIYAKTIDGKTFSFIVKTTDRVIDIKKSIEEKMQISNYQIHLIYKGMMLMDDDRTIDDYNIEDHSVILVVARLPGGAFSFKVIIGDHGYIFDLTLSSPVTILEIKNLLQRETGLSPEEQQLMHGGRILEDGQRITDGCNTTLTECVTIVDRPRSIFARRSLRMQIEMSVKLMNTIIDIKRMINGIMGLSSCKQILKLSGNVLIDDKKVYEYKIVTNSNIDVIEILTIILLSENMETIPVEIMSDDRIIDVKKKIELKTGLSCEDQILKFKNETMKDEDIVDCYNIRSMSDIAMSLTRGLCVIISNEKFNGGYDDRTGTTLDEDKIRNTFQPLGYEIKVYQNLSSSSMETSIEEIKQSVRETQRKMIVFVLTHGSMDEIVMSDGSRMKVKDIWTPFSNDRFTEFAGKSKWFFFASCLGLNNVRYETPSSTSDLMCVTTNLFVGHARYESTVSCRDLTGGTIYIDCLCKVLRDHPRWSIVDIYKEVQSILSRSLLEDQHF